MSNKNITVKDLKKAMLHIVNKYQIEVAYLFGSQAGRNEINDSSDIDIGILLRMPNNKRKINFGLEISIETLLHKILNLQEKIDVRIIIWNYKKRFNSSGYF